jgi:hypothetical protein
VAAPKILLGIVVLLLRMTKSGPSKNSSFKINFTISRTHRKTKKQLGANAASAAACAIGAFIGLHGQKRIKKNSDLAWV